MSYTLSDNISSVAWTPDYSPDLGGAKNESVHFTPNNTFYNYKWSDRIIHKHTISYASSADAYLFNYWWFNSTRLVYTPEYSLTDVSTIILTGKSLPAAKYEKPYNDLFMIKLIVESVK